ncbi:unnamed protein product [Paramecium sonneborni]|uniref:YeeE/YedE family protein n=1 Tax=Paramecium sonneborni TaxID=65129 RepID=A0A8S1LKL5_9CILI|nr:unnamed protein product [Paramecium sonneborni]
MILNWNDIQLAAAGGLLIGLATSIHYLLKGRVTGFSGIFYSLITFDKNSFYWKLSLVSSVVLSSSLLYKYYGFNPILQGASSSFDSINSISKIGYIGAAIAGFLVGFGTKLGNGCTSGHGVCGLPRLSQRSMAAVASFMTFGILTATIKDQLVLEQPTQLIIDNPDITNIAAMAISGILTLVGIIGQTKQNQKTMIDAIISSIVGLIFGAGLVVSGMAKRSKILGFLTFNQNWDPSLMFVMIGAVSLNLITFNLLKKPILSDKYELPTNKKIDFKLILGASIFGIGWGIGGLCPGPAFSLFPQFTAQIAIMFLPCLALGQITANQFSSFLDRKQKPL